MHKELPAHTIAAAALLLALLLGGCASTKFHLRGHGDANVYGNPARQLPTVTLRQGQEVAVMSSHGIGFPGGGSFINLLVEDESVAKVLHTGETRLQAQRPGQTKAYYAASANSPPDEDNLSHPFYYGRGGEPLYAPWFWIEVLPDAPAQTTAAPTP